MDSTTSRISPLPTSSTSLRGVPQVQKSLSGKLETVTFSLFHAKTTQLLCQAAAPVVSAGILHFTSLRLRLPQSVVMALTGCIATAILGIQGLRSQEKILFEISLAYTIIHNKIRDNNWWDEMNDHLILGGIPLTDDLDRLCDAGVRAVLVMLEDHETDSEAIPPISQQEWKEEGIVYKRIPAKDFLGVPVEQLMEAVKFIEEQIKAKKKVYVHCKAGRGRSVSAAIAYFLASGTYKSFQEACAFVKRIRPQISLNSRQQAAIQQYPNANELMQYQMRAKDLFQNVELMKSLLRTKSASAQCQHLQTKVLHLLGQHKLVYAHDKQLSSKEEGQEFIVLENAEYSHLYAKICTVKKDPLGVLYFSPNQNEEILLSTADAAQLPISIGTIKDESSYFEQLKSYQGQRHLLPPEWVQSLLTSVNLNIPNENISIHDGRQQAYVYEAILTDISRTNTITINGEMIYDNKNPQPAQTIVQECHRKLGLSVKHSLETLKLCTQASSVYGSMVNHWLLENVLWAVPTVVNRSITIHTLKFGQIEICVNSIIAMKDQDDGELLSFFFKDTLRMVLNNQELEKKSINSLTTPLITETLSPCFSSQKLAENYGKPLSTGHLIVQKLLTVKGAVISGLFASCVLIPLSIAHHTWQGRLAEWSTVKTLRLATTPLAIFLGGTWAIRKIQRAVGG